MEQAFLSLLDRLQPNARYMRLFREIVLDVWQSQGRNALKERTRLEKRVEVLQSQQDELDEAFIYQHRIDTASYERQRDKLREETASTQMELADAKVLELDMETTLSFAQHLMTNAARCWMEAPAERKRRLQDAFFPEGLAFDGEGFGTAVTCLAFRDLGESQTGNEGMASPTGFEPVLQP